jgi:hypothetical protein
MVVEVEIAAVDLVGNRGVVATLSDRVGESTATLDDPGDPTGESLEGIGFSRESAPIDGEESAQLASEDAPITAAAAYTENNCVGTPSPCGTYNGRAAAAYARYWYSRRSSSYPRFGNDCTNFISQALRAGGMRFMRAGGNNDPVPSVPTFLDEYEKGEGSWWSAKLVQGSGTAPIYHWTHSWSLAETSHDRILEYDIGVVLGSTARLRAGDLVYYRFRGSDGEFPTEHGRWTHAAIVTRVTKQGAWIAQHTSDYERTLGDVFARLRATQGVRGVDWRVAIVRPTRTEYDIG